jgi:hypothetical protein
MDSGAHARPDEPIQPLLVDDVSANVRGVVFEGGQYTAYTAFDPVVTRLGDSDEPLGEETTIADTVWRESQLVSLSRLETVGGVQQRVVVLPGQYRGSDGQQRVYEEVQVSLYSSTSSDWFAPTIEGVAHTVSGASVTVVVTATDGGGICRVVVAYTDGKGSWSTVDLANIGGDVWQGTLPLSGALEYFVQVVDGAGNVTIDDNDGSYYQEGVDVYPVYLPVVLRAYEP